MVQLLFISSGCWRTQSSEVRGLHVSAYLLFLLWISPFIHFVHGKRNCHTHFQGTNCPVNNIQARARPSHNRPRVYSSARLLLITRMPASQPTIESAGFAGARTRRCPRTPAGLPAAVQHRGQRPPHAPLPRGDIPHRSASTASVTPAPPVATAAGYHTGQGRSQAEAVNSVRPVAGQERRGF